MKFSHDHLLVQCILPKRSKARIDEVDIALGAHFGFTQAQLDFVLNYDIKYRLGQSTKDTDD